MCAELSYWRYTNSLNSFVLYLRSSATQNIQHINKKNHENSMFEININKGLKTRYKLYIIRFYSNYKI